MNVDEKASLVRLFNTALEARDEITCNEVIEKFADEGNPIAETLCHRLLDVQYPDRNRL